MARVSVWAVARVRPRKWLGLEHGLWLELGYGQWLGLGQGSG